MPQFRKMPVVITAEQYAGTGVPAIAAGRSDVKEIEHFGDGYRLQIPTLEGTMEARPGDWIIQGVTGELYPCKPDIFERTYEPVAD